MASVRHPNVISYLGVCAEPACIVTEYCSKGSLTDVLRRGRASLAHRAALDWPRRLNMAMDAAKVTFDQFSKIECVTTVSTQSDYHILQKHLLV
jgi:serine/threonine protein kinase